MRLDFQQDKRLMQEAADGGGDASRQLQALEAAKAGLKNDPAAQQVLQETIQSLKAKMGVAGQVAQSAGTAGVTAASGVQAKSGTASVEVAENAAKTGQQSWSKSIDTLIAMLQQSGTGLMQSEQSIEQMKAGFSGMIEIVGIVAKHLGADEFADSCIDLAKKLKPNLVTLNPAAKKAVQDFKDSIPEQMRPEAWQSYITSGQAAANEAITQGGKIVVEQAKLGVHNAGEIPQPTALGMTGSGVAASTLSSAVSKHFGKLLTDGIITGPQNAQLRKSLLTADANHDGQLDGAEQRAFGTGAVAMLGATKAAVVKRELEITGAPNAAPLILGAPTSAPAPTTPAPR